MLAPWTMLGVVGESPVLQGGVGRVRIRQRQRMLSEDKRETEHAMTG